MRSRTTEYWIPLRGALRRITVLWLLLTCNGQRVSAADYDPLSKPEASKLRVEELTVEDPLRDREIPLKVYLPASSAPAPVILFSHGLGGTRNGCVYLGEHWSARGYVVVYMQHHGSDDDVWRDLRLAERIINMRRAGSTENLLLRVGDVHRVLDELQRMNKESDHPLTGRLNMDCVGMSGHSFGAITAQVVGGQVYADHDGLAEKRIRAVLALSPSSPRAGEPELAFGSVSIPWMLMTGTKDVVAIFKTDVASRRNVYRNLPDSVDRYELVLHDGQHSAFTDVRIPGDRGPRNPNHHRIVLALSTAFWDYYLQDEPRAVEWLRSDALKTVLEKDDAWQWGKGTPEAAKMGGE